MSYIKGYLYLNKLYCSFIQNIYNKNLTNDKKIKEDEDYNEQKKMCYKEKLAIRILNKSKVILNSKAEGGNITFIFESVNYGDYNISINNEKLLQIKEYFIQNKKTTSASFPFELELVLNLSEILNLCFG